MHTGTPVEPLYDALRDRVPATAPRTLWLGDCAAARNSLHLTFGVDELRFQTTLWYEGVDFQALRDDHGERFVAKLLFHIAAFEANKLCSLRPEVFDLGPYADLYTPAFDALWTIVADKVWAEWRYRHGTPDQRPPRILAPTCAGDALAAVPSPPAKVDTLMFCGGGKDSLVMMRLLETAGIPYAALGYSHSAYGQPDLQHELIGRLLDHGRPERAHRLWLIEDFMTSPVVALRPDLGVECVTAAETPASLFAALPLALARGYRHLLVGHERSADVGNLTWDATGEEVNHQWGKSLEAERLLQAYVRAELACDVTYASALKPITDTVIFSMLDPGDPGLAHTHSCNRRKPWCERCAKCAYVWLGYQAHLPVGTVDPMFSANLFDDPANQLYFSQMLGLEAHTPFECVGGVDEARLCFSLCRDKGITGAAVDRFAAQELEVDASSLVDLCTAEPANHAMPPELHERIAPQLVDAADRVRATVGR